MNRTTTASAGFRLATLPAHRLREMIGKREISIPELVADSLAAIAAHDGAIHAFVATCPEQALAEAEAAQARLRAARDAALGFDTGVEPDDRLLGWERRSAELVTGGETVLMTPQPGTVYGPDDWEEATLDDWLHPGAP